MKVVKSKDVERKVVEMDGAEGVAVRWLIADADGAKNFAMRLFEVAPGGHTPLHTHPHEHEVFVIAGTGKLVFEDGEYDFSPEDVIFVDGGKEHCFKNTGDSVLRFLCLIPADAA